MDRKLEIAAFAVGSMNTNCYIVTDAATRLAALIDPGAVSERLDPYLESAGIRSLEYILLTHGHFDHIAGAGYYADKYGAPLCVHRLDAGAVRGGPGNLSEYFDEPCPALEPDRIWEDGDVFDLGSTRFEVLHTPGHTPGSVCYISDDRVMFSGDTIFRITYGRTDLDGGDFDTLTRSLTRIAELPGEYLILPGHGPETALEYERTHDRWLKRHWRPASDDRTD